MRKQKIKEVLWGIGLVAAAVYIVMNQMHLLSFHLGLGTIFWTVVFGILLINSIAGKSIFGMVFSVTFLLIVYAGPLHITKIVPWTLLLAACLVYVGLCLIFSKGWRRDTLFRINHHQVKHDQIWEDGEFKATGDNFSSRSRDEDERNIVINQRLSEVSRYVHSQNLESVTINSTLGETNVYLDSAKAADDTVVINLNASLGDVEIYLPLSWQIEDHLEAVFGEVEINGTSTGGGPKVILQGSSKFGQVTINYV